MSASNLLKIDMVKCPKKLAIPFPSAHEKIRPFESL